MHVGLAVRHPESARFFGPVGRELLDRGHEVTPFVREHGRTTALLSRAGLPADVLATEPSTRAGLLAGHLRYEACLLARARRRDVDVLASIGGRAVSHVAPLAGARSVVFVDWEPSAVDRLVAGLADTVATPSYLAGAFAGTTGATQAVYGGVPELAHLGPRGARSPVSAESLDWGPLTGGTPAGGRAAGDGGDATDGRRGPADDAAPAGVVGVADPAAGWVEPVCTLLASRGPVYLVADDDVREDGLDGDGFDGGEREDDAPDGDAVRRCGSVDGVRHRLGSAPVCVGDRGTLTAEAAVLGCPAVHVGRLPRRCRHLRDEYGLVVAATADDAPERVARLADGTDGGGRAERRRRLLDDAGDVVERAADVVLGAD